MKDTSIWFQPECSLWGIHVVVRTNATQTWDGVLISRDWEVNLWIKKTTVNYAYPLNIMRQIGKIIAGVFGGNVVCRKYYSVWST